MTDDLRIKKMKSLISASLLAEQMPITEKSHATVLDSRLSIEKCIKGDTDKLLVIVGPCSIHDEKSALEYGQNLVKLIDKYKDSLCIVMRVYFEKPRTTVGWKGYINDPYLDGTFDINTGLKNARSLLLKLTTMGVPCGTEFLDVISPQYISDLVSWGAIGARTTESQIHRELASGLSCSVGFKNGTDGNIQVAVDAILSSQSCHHFLGVLKHGNTAIFETTGNKSTHIILRGGKAGTNFDLENVKKTYQSELESGLSTKIMIDCSHGNSDKKHRNQLKVVDYISENIKNKNYKVMGLMIESHINEGNQKISDNMKYGVSITDACVNWKDTMYMLEKLSQSVIKNRG